MCKQSWRRAAAAILVAFAGVTSSAVAEVGIDAPIWVSADYLMWWTDAADTPSLVTTSPAGVSRENAGVLGQPATRTLLGGALNNSMRSGLRLRAGSWLDEEQVLGIEFNYLQLETLRASYQQGSGGDPIVARPFTDANSGGEVAELAAFSPDVAGSLDASVQSEGLYGWGVNLRCQLQQCSASCYDPCSCCEVTQSQRWDFLVGYRGLRLDDRVSIRERLTSPLLARGTFLDLQDVFDTENTFHGLNLGLVYTRKRCRWMIESFGNLGIGATESRVLIDGRTTVVSTSGPVASSGGVLALASNMGETAVSDFTAIFDAGCNLGFQITDGVTVRFGYSFLLWPNVYRAGQQIDMVVNPNLFPPVQATAGQPMRPQRLDQKTEFWAHGLKLGLEYRF